MAYNPPILPSSLLLPILLCQAVLLNMCPLGPCHYPSPHTPSAAANWPIWWTNQELGQLLLFSAEAHPEVCVGGGSKGSKNDVQSGLSAPKFLSEHFIWCSLKTVDFYKIITNTWFFGGFYLRVERQETGCERRMWHWANDLTENRTRASRVFDHSAKWATRASPGTNNC